MIGLNYSTFDCIINRFLFLIWLRLCFSARNNFIADILRLAVCCTYTARTNLSVPTIAGILKNKQTNNQQQHTKQENKTKKPHTDSLANQSALTL
jgi:hypothetical protein